MYFYILQVKFILVQFLLMQCWKNMLISGSWLVKQTPKEPVLQYTAGHHDIFSQDITDTPELPISPEEDSPVYVCQNDTTGLR
ncbi:hypothetical protein NPIL_557641 [Nephila pilipes]|uniref:Uncharacterized protein n=1 Tax=Nephila pilipes TaxID=299642 RepID=A0A8X6P5U3_NEPPI|nr:hypothetical protein NPIL_557641 [Nephila pilipes]